MFPSMVQKMFKKKIAIARLTSYKWLFYMFKVFGIATVSLSSGSPEVGESHLFSTSKLGIAYNVFLIVSLLALNYVSVNIMSSEDFASCIKFEKTMDLIQIALAVGATVIILACYSLRQARIVDLLNKMKLIRDSSLFYPRTSFVDTTRSDILKVLLGNLACWLAIVVTSEIESVQLAIIHFTDFISTFINSVLVMQYSIALIFVRHFLKMINSELRGISTSNEAYRVSFEDSSDQRILQLKRLTSLVHEFARDISDFYSLTMFLNIVYNFLLLVYCTYYMAKPVLLGKNDMTDFIMSHCFFCFVNGFVSLCIITKLVTSTTSESKKTGAIASDFNDNCNKEVRKKLNQFSNYLSHNNVEFKVYSFYSLDESLLVAIISSIVTYMVILLQFQEKK